jgi:hypothetical protein
VVIYRATYVGAAADNRAYGFTWATLMIGLLAGPAIALYAATAR